MNIKKSLLVSFVAILSIADIPAQNLPVKEILGQEYYTYKVKKGDSIYGLVHRFGWDEKEFLRLNPSVADGLKKDEIVYYPTGRASKVEIEPSAPAKKVPASMPKLVHEVKRGETVYSISRLYDIPIQTIYDASPSSRKGIKAGEKIVIDQNAAGFGDPARIPFYYIRIKPGDTLYSTAGEVGLTVEDLLLANPGMSETNFRSGDMLKIPVSDTPPKVRREMVEVRELSSLSSYKVEKNDTWNSISSKAGVEASELKEANTGMGSLKKDDVIAIPEISTVTVEKETPYTDIREQTASGRREIYDSIHHVDSGNANDVRIALIMDDSSSRRDVEFTRGFLLALNQLGDPGFKVNFKVADAAEGDSLLRMQIEEFRPGMIISLSDKGVADWMTQAGLSQGAETLNVFDTRTDDYTTNPSLIQLLIPSTYFYDSVSSAIAERYAGRRILNVTKDGTPDPLVDTIEAALSDSDSSNVFIDNLNPSLIPTKEDLLVIADLTDKKDIEQLFAQLELVREQNPVVDIVVVGKPSWVVFAESMIDKFYDNNVVVPSRFFFDAESEKGKAFIADYTTLFGRGPLKSYPNYAATGYDVANFFIPALALNDGDFNVSVPATDYLQMPVSLLRKSNWGGFFNSKSMLIRFTPYRTIDIIES